MNLRHEMHVDPIKEVHTDWNYAPYEDPDRLVLRDYQVAGRDWLRNKKRAFLTDWPGLGKTVQATEAAETPALVVAPTYLVEQWYNFLCKQKPDAKVGFCSGDRKNRTATLKKRWDWLVINVQMLRSYAIPDYFKTIIFDESHHLRNRNATQSIGAAKLAKDMSKNVYLLTATPMWKEVDDLWHQLHILQPDIFNSYHDFVDLFMIVDKDAMHGNKILGVKRSMRKSLEQLLSAISFGRTYVQAGRALPPTITSKFTVTLPKPLREAYQELITYYQLQLSEDETKIFTNYISVMHTLRNITACPEKVDAVVRRIEDNKKPAVVFTWYKDTAERVQEQVPDSILVTGDYDPNERTRMAHKAQKNGQTIVATAPSMREGINLSQYRSVIFFEEDWPPGSNFQALSRVVRDRNDNGIDKDVVLVDYIHAGKTIDEVIHKVAQRRTASIKEVMKEILM